MKSQLSLVFRFTLAGVVLLILALHWSGYFAPDKTWPNGAAQAQVAPSLNWKTATPAQRSAAQASIRAQLGAFKNGDWNKAVSFQSANLKRNFASTAAFKSMMGTTYPQFVNFKSITFGAARTTGNIIQIQVELTGSDGVKVGAIYSMVKEKAGYRVDGVSGGATGAPRPKIRQKPADYV